MVQEEERGVISERSIRFAAVGDIHCRKESAGSLRPFFAQAAEAADALLLCGDLTDYGLPEETHVLVEELAAARIPIVAVLGNHDFESDQQDEVRRILTEAGVRVLDGEACEIHGVGIVGAKGFAGGYGRGALGPWGETAIKHFVQEAIQEALKLEAALAKLRTPQVERPKDGGVTIVLDAVDGDAITTRFEAQVSVDDEVVVRRLPIQ